MKKLFVSLLAAGCALSATMGLTACGNDGKDGINGENGKDGKDGVGITNTQINEDGELVITLSDGTVKNLGVIVGSNGADGNDGSDGNDGLDGKDGVGIKDVKFDADGNMTVILTDGTTKNLGKIPYCTHSFGEWETVLEASCTSIGYSTHECEICGYVEYEFTEAAGHKWNDGEPYSDRILKICTDCGATKIEEKYVPTYDDVKFILPVQNSEIIFKFGEDKRNPSLDMVMTHKGIDFGCEQGTEVVAAFDGKVTSITPSWLECSITIELFDGFTTTYKYLTVNESLKVGDEIKQGDVIGMVNAGDMMENFIGDHLHFECSIDNKVVDPTQYFNPDDLVYADDTNKN